MGLFERWDEILENQPAWLEVPINKKLYEQAEAIIRSLGSTPEDAVRLLLQDLVELLQDLVEKADTIQNQLTQGGQPQQLLQDVVTTTNNDIGNSRAHHEGELSFRDLIDTSAPASLVEVRERVFSVTALRKRQRSVFDYIETPGNVAVITRHGVRECVLMSMSTYTSLLNYVDVLARQCSQYDSTAQKQHCKER